MVRVVLLSLRQHIGIVDLGVLDSRCCRCRGIIALGMILSIFWEASASVVVVVVVVVVAESHL